MSNGIGAKARFDAVRDLISRSPRKFDPPRDDQGKRLRVSEFFGVNTFDLLRMKEKLPKEYALVLVNGDDGIFRAYCDENTEYASWQCSPIGSYAGDGCVFGITHWMPLPKPPET